MDTGSDWSPAVSAKTTVTTLAGALVTLLIFAAELAGVEVPPEVAAAAVTVAMALMAYLLPVRRNTRARH